MFVLLVVAGVGDSGDHWRVMCDGDFWDRDDEVVFKHVDTGAFLSTSGSTANRSCKAFIERWGS